MPNAPIQVTIFYVPETADLAYSYYEDTGGAEDAPVETDRPDRPYALTVLMPEDLLSPAALRAISQQLLEELEHAATVTYQHG